MNYKGLRDITVTLTAGSAEKRLLHLYIIYIDILLSFSMLFCDIFSKDAKCTNHISDWFNFCCCFVLSKSAVESSSTVKNSLLQPNDNSHEYHGQADALNACNTIPS